MNWNLLPQDPTDHSMATNPWAPKPLLTALTMINTCLAWSAYQADSWCLVNGTQWHRQSKHWRSGPRHPCTVSAQKNITVKADTHSNIYSHIKTELNNSKTEKLTKLKEYLYSIVLSTGSQKVISTASTDHWRSGPRHHSSLYGVCAEDHYCKSMHTLSHLFSHSNKIKQQQNWKLTKLWVQVLKSTVRRLQEVISMASTV